MYDDYDLDYTYVPEYTYDLDETYDAWVQSFANASHLDEDLDEEYTRNAQDYDALAYKHYAWYNVMHTPTHSRAMYASTKRTIRVTLDIECYDDLELESYDWNEVLGLEGDENVHVSMEEIELWWYDVPVRDLSTSAWGWIFYVYRKAGAVAMYFRLQGYPAPRLISYRIAPHHPITTSRVPLREVSTIATQGAGLVYC